MPEERMRQNIIRKCFQSRTRHYHYYHCGARCGIRFNAEAVNESFENELMRYVPQPGMAELYKITLTQAYNHHAGFRTSDKKYDEPVGQDQPKVENAREMRADKEIDLDDFQTLKKECDEQTNLLLGQKEQGIDGLIELGIYKLLLLQRAMRRQRSQKTRDHWFDFSGKMGF